MSDHLISKTHKRGYRPALIARTKRNFWLTLRYIAVKTEPRPLSIQLLAVRKSDHAVVWLNCMKNCIARWNWMNTRTLSVVSKKKSL